jgi:16S rRNA processing protein RimM
MGYPDYFFLGKIFRTHGIKGHLILYLESRENIIFKKVKTFFIAIEGELKEFKLKEIAVTPPNIRFALDEIDTMTKAETLLKKDVYLPINVLPKRKKNEFYFEDLINAKVIDSEKGELGLIKEILNYPQQTLAQLIYNNSEVLFPLNENFIERFDKNENTLYVNLPEGLIDLYTENKK